MPKNTQGKDVDKLQIQNLRKAIEAGERSGYVKDFDSQKHLQQLNKDFQNEI